MSVKKGTFTFAFPFQAGTTGAAIADSLAKKLTEKGVLGKRPNMGAHATIIPPFIAPRKEVLNLARACRQQWELFRGTYVEAEVKSIGMFTPQPITQQTAIYIELGMPSRYHELVEIQKINWSYPFRHPLARQYAVEPVWIPHITIIEGAGLYTNQKAIEVLPELLGGVAFLKLPLPEPRFFEEKYYSTIKRWEPILV